MVLKMRASLMPVFDYLSRDIATERERRLVTLGYTGAYQDLVTGTYPLGNGYRTFLPGHMRFASPDDWSPFGPGGPNPYTYCAADPINRKDPSGHVPVGSVEEFVTELVSTETRRAEQEAASAIAAEQARAAANTSGASVDEIRAGLPSTSSDPRGTLAERRGAKRPGAPLPPPLKLMRYERLSAEDVGREVDDIQRQVRSLEQQAHELSGLVPGYRRELAAGQAGNALTQRLSVNTGTFARDASDLSSRIAALTRGIENAGFPEALEILRNANESIQTYSTIGFDSFRRLTEENEAVFNNRFGPNGGPDQTPN